MSLRHSGRQAAVKILYSLEFSDEKPETAADAYWSDSKASRKMKTYAMSLINGVCENRDQIDTAIDKASAHWPVKRMPVVDLCILRLAVYELMICNDIPVAVAINEAVELAKDFSGQESASFINGILGNIVKEVERLGDKP